MAVTKCDSVNHTRHPVRGSPASLSTPGQQSYKRVTVYSGHFSLHDLTGQYSVANRSAGQ